MSIKVNGTEQELDGKLTVLDVVARTTDKEFNPDGTPTDGSRPGIAAALNGAVIPRARWAETDVADGAVIDIVTAVQGG